MKILIGNRSLSTEIRHLDTALAIADIQIEKLREVRKLLLTRWEEVAAQPNSDHMLGYVEALELVDSLLCQVLGSEYENE